MVSKVAHYCAICDAPIRRSGKTGWSHLRVASDGHKPVPDPKKDGSPGPKPSPDVEQIHLFPSNIALTLRLVQDVTRAIRDLAEQCNTSDDNVAVRGIINDAVDLYGLNE